ncbi:hypothetical protein [Mangrovibrevibacter kandeliae]|uniref:hypothetical protein n=1 Tax=Mangrovibrevibacter kandeliae TaxID=2968473 RepID=UPI002117E8B0|nr:MULTISPECIES: hypothetical protein [unclassified Aurantimonas]MCQ8780952.1 hypothetical protein [Aurantimonas sp. CSK15Z-1]MCW4113733.1 hypothetical protein [Aurantimonas sp. MSK8Z-1]
MTPPHLNEDEARQGERGTPVLRVLIAAMVIAAIVFLGLILYYNYALPDDTIPSPTTGSDVETVSPQPSTPAENGQTTVTPDQSNAEPGAAPATAN